MADSSKMREEQIVASTTAEPTSTTAPVESENEDKPSPSSFSPEPAVTPTPETSEVVLQRLARQVEYYFSTANLSKDTYVATLRSLNDGFVPISIIASFGKVNTLVPYDALNAVRRAASECSDLLEVVNINTHTGKRVAVDENDLDSLSTLEAVGPISGEAIPMEKIQTAVPVTPPAVKPVSFVQNTFIIREVPQGTEESHIKELFNFETCPSIKDVHLDFADCWYVTLDSQSRDDMVNVVFELRKKKFSSGEPVLARLKSGVVMNSDSPSSLAFINSGNPMVYAPQLSAPGRFMTNNGGRKNKKKKNITKTNSRTSGTSTIQSKTAKGKTTTTTSSNNGTTRRNNGTKQKKNGLERQQKEDGRSSQSPSTQKTLVEQGPPPTLGEEQFPALPSDESVSSPNKIEVEKVPQPQDDFGYDEFEKNRAGSDSASTATTTSSSSSSKQVIGGYAAALLKTAPPKSVQPPKEKAATQPKTTAKNTSEKKGNKKAAGSNDKSSEASRPKNPSVPVRETTPVAVAPPSWGAGRSFADVLRKETAAAAAATPEQSA